MDIQNNNILTLIHFNPITNSEISKNDINLDKIKDNNILFLFNEYTKVKLILKSQNKNAYVKTLNIRSKKYITTPSNIELEVSSGVENKKYLPPGEYPIYIDLGFKKINKVFKVIPNILDLEDYSKIINYLETKEVGLTKENKINKDCKINLSNNNEINNKYCNLNNLLENKEKILKSIDLIIKNPIFDEQNIYIKTKNINKLDKKTINSLLKKGINPEECNTFYQKKKINNIDNIGNQNIKYLINDIHNLISENKINIEKEIEKIENKLIVKEEELNNLRKKLDVTIDNIFLSDNAKTNQKTNFMLSKNYIKKEKSKILKLKDLYNSLSKMQLDIKVKINNSWLKEIKECNSINVKIKNTYYNNLYQLYKKIYDLETTLNINKHTSIIYEIYSLLKIIDALKELGFNLENNNIKSNYNICLTNKEYKIILDIEKEISKELKNSESSQFISINSKHCTPDIKLTLYKEDQIIKSMIFEVKCRKQKYLYNSQGDTNVIEQLKDYLSFAYYDKNTKKIDRSIIEEVVLIYPIQEIEYEYESFLNISFCQLGETQESFLTEKIEKFLIKNIK